jgi:acylphosphatase
MVKNLKLRIFGDVQCVGFRYEAKIIAEKLGLKGFARNEDGGFVRVEAEGEEKDLKAFLEWCRKGPSSAKVEKIDVEFGDGPGGFNGFRIE